MIRAVYGLMGLGMCLLSAPALANLSLVNYNGFEVRQSGNTWQFGHASSESTRLRGGTVLPNAAVSSSQRALVVSKNLPVGKGLIVDVVAKIPASSLARLAVGAAKASTGIGALLVAKDIYDHFHDAGLTEVRNTAEGLVATTYGEPGEVETSDGKEYKLTHGSATDWHLSQYRACMSGGSALIAGNFLNKQDYDWSVEGVINNQCVIRGKRKGNTNIQDILDYYSIQSRASGCSAGSYITGGSCSPTRPKIQLNEQQILDKMTITSAWGPTAQKVVQKAADLGVPIETDTPSVSGPSSVPGEKKTTKESVRLNPGTNTPAAPGTQNTDPGTKTTTKTETKKAEYSGPNVTTSTTTTTVTNITNNITNITTTETDSEEKEDDKEQEEPPTDTPFKDIPELYKQKYPDGIGGVVNKKMDELKATPLFGLPALLTPSLPSTGSCPSWQLDLSLASWAGYGTHTIQAPCWVWDFGKVVIIISALLLARRLIFGG